MPRRPTWRHAGRLVAAGLAVIGAALLPCDRTPAAATLEEHLEALTVQVPPEPVQAPAFALIRSDGRPVTLQDLRGKMVFLNFWATWCVPCRAEMPAIEKLHRIYRDRAFAVVAVNFKETSVQVQAFLAELGLTFPAALDADGAVARRFAVRGLPVSFLLDRDGRILWKALGAREWDGPNGLAYLDRLLPPRQP